MRKSVFSVALLIAIWLMVWAPREAQAQATGSIAGVVTDETGAVIPGVTVTITNTATNQSRTTVTGTDGYYSVLLLQPGQFEVKATLAGFKTVTRDDITVDRRVDLTCRHEARRRPSRRERHCLDAGAARRNLERHPRHRHRSEEDRRPAAERTQLHQLGPLLPGVDRGARFGRRRVRRRHARRLRRGHGRLQRQRHAEPVEQLPARRREQQRHVQHRVRDAAAARRDPGIQDPDALLQRGVRPQLRLGRQRRDPSRAPTPCTARPGNSTATTRSRRGTSSRRRPGQAEVEAEPVRRAASAGRFSGTGCSGSGTTRDTATRAARR